MKTIMISPVGEPGSGKSTFSFWLTAQLKMAGVVTEFVPEVIKYESYDPQHFKDRVLSGRFDFRFLRRQQALTRPLIGRCEVIVNDGALPPFLYYAQQRLSGQALERFEAAIQNNYRAQSEAEHRYVTLVRQHAYETHGRGHSDEESLTMRGQLLTCLETEFDIQPVVLDSPYTKEAYTQDLIHEVKRRRMEATPKRSHRP